jgi:hypothetical protein
MWGVWLCGASISGRSSLVGTVQEVTCHVRVLHDYSSRIQSPLHEEQNVIPQEPKQQPLSVIRTVGVSLRPTGETLAVRRSFQGGTDDKHD